MKRWQLGTVKVPGSDSPLWPSNLETVTSSLFFICTCLMYLKIGEKVRKKLSSPWLRYHGSHSIYFSYTCWEHFLEPLPASLTASLQSHRHVKASFCWKNQKICQHETEGFTLPRKLIPLSCRPGEGLKAHCKISELQSVPSKLLQSKLPSKDADWTWCNP